MTPHSRELAEYVDGLIEAQRETRGDYLTYGTPDPELVDIAALLRREPSVEEVARALCRAARIQQGFKDTPDYTLADEIDNAWDLWLPEAQAVAAQFFGSSAAPIPTEGQSSDSGSGRPE